MKFLQVILSLSLLLLVPLLVVESSSSLNDISVTNITRGSFLYSNDASPYWLSPSGNIAFGFYQLPWSPDKYTVGIWFVKSSNKTLVWTANLEDLIPMNKPSAVLFTKEGKLVLRILPDNKEKPLLPNAPEPVSYAKLHDNGNFVLYGSDSQIVWESFDYPTDTLQLWSMIDDIIGVSIPIILVGVLLVAIVMLVRAQPDQNLKEEETTKIIGQKEKDPTKTSKGGYEKLDTSSDLESGRI